MSQYTANQCSSTNGANSNDNQHERQQLNFTVQIKSQNGQAQEHGHTNGAELPVQNIAPILASNNYTPNINTNGFDGMNMMNGINQQLPVCAQGPTMYENNAIPNGTCSIHPSHSLPTNGANYIVMGYPQNPSWYPNASMHHSPSGHVYPTAPENENPHSQNKQKRLRTAFTTRQIRTLEQEYLKDRYLERERRLVLAHALGLNDRTIKIWFQNRRMKEKKDRTPEEASVSSVSSPGFPIMISPSEIMNPLRAINFPPPPPSLIPPPPYAPPRIPSFPRSPRSPIIIPIHNISLPSPSSSMAQAHFSGHQSVSGSFSNVPPQVQPTPEIAEVPTTSTASWDLSWLKDINTDDPVDS